MTENLNDHFPNPFEYLEFDLNPPFEIIENKNDLDRIETNIVIDYFLFIQRIRFNPFLSYEEMIRNKEKILYITMFIDLPEYELTFNKVKEFNTKGSYNVKKYFPYINFELPLIERDSFEDVKIKENHKEFTNLIPQSKYVVNIVYPKIIKFQVKFHFAKKDENELDVLKTKLGKISQFYGNLFGNPELYPKYVKEGDVIRLKYPDKYNAYEIQEVIKDK